MFTKRDLLRSAAMSALTVAMAKSTPAIAQNNADWPRLLEAKNIAEEGFIYGLPLVMNYAVMQE
ncbi:cell envelope protein, partial [Bradyrhizobium sp. Mp64]|nr:cell envelope protein [Bradyrhizobium sp. Mp64]